MGTSNVLANGVLCTFVTTGTGTITLGNAITGYFDPTGAQITTGSRVSYCLVDSLTAPTTREYGEGVLSFGASWTLTRPTIRRSLSGGVAGSSAINWAVGTKYVFLTPLATDLSLTGLGMSAFGISLTDVADAAAARALLSVQPTASPAFTTTANITRGGAGVLQTWADTVASLTAQLGSDGATIYVGTFSNAPFRLLVNNATALFLDGRVMTGGLSTPAAGYTGTGDVTLPAAAAIRARNTAAAAAFFSFNGGSLTTNRAWNCTIARSSAGVGTVTFTNAFNNANYVVTGQANITTGTPGDAVPLAIWGKTVNGFSFACKVAGNATYYDAPLIEFAAFDI